jgi:hypothetical protein
MPKSSKVYLQEQAPLICANVQRLGDIGWNSLSRNLLQGIQHDARHVL